MALTWHTRPTDSKGTRKDEKAYQPQTDPPPPRSEHRSLPHADVRTTSPLAFSLIDHATLKHTPSKQWQTAYANATNPVSLQTEPTIR